MENEEKKKEEKEIEEQQEELNIQQKLLKIQQELKAPKGQYNDFGKYKFRSCEDILESVKPLLKKYECTLTVNDTLEYIGERYYIKATAMLVDTKMSGCISNNAYAREEESKKGMDGSQLTGTASSYARKYALNGLFAIDDTKDADTNEFKKQQQTKITKDQINKIKELVEDIDAMLNYYELDKIEDMDYETAEYVIAKKSQ